MRVKSIKFDEFMRDEKKPSKVSSVAKVIGLTTALLVVPDIAFAQSSIDIAAHRIYGNLLTIGKWIIIIKGGIDTINYVVKGDIVTARKSFMGYLVVYMVLQGLPWAMNEVDKLFSEMTVG